MILQPGHTIGVVGGGQLGRMFTLEARRAGYKVVVFTDEPPGSPAGQIADFEISAPYTDAAAAADFARRAEVVTYEFENVPADFLTKLESLGVPVRPGVAALSTCQNREREKLFLRAHGIPCAPFAIIDSLDSLRAAVAAIPAPCVLKTADFGYDGKGQIKISDPAQIDEAWKNLGSPRGVLEAWISCRMELSVIAARGMDGQFVAFPPAENDHRRHILDTTILPARVDADTAARAIAMAKQVADALGFVGTLAVEFFLDGSGKLLVNEIAPRPHNSGHATIDACSVSQFGQQLRAITGQRLAEPRLISPIVMVNLLGDVWPGPEKDPDWSPILEDPDARLHLYGKRVARRGRKMGHFCVLAPETGTALAKARALKDRLDEAVAVAVGH
jgi:5-(carboxyamino)imidazole ribonucleotide synthase